MDAFESLKTDKHIAMVINFKDGKWIVRAGSLDSYHTVIDGTNLLETIKEALMELDSI